MILFVDFDGVLHPEGLTAETRHRLFCAAPRLHQILHALPAAEVVLSSSWRLLYPLGQLVEMATVDAPELRARFVGVTPHIEARERPQGVVGQREDEARAWLARNAPGRDWLGLDDFADFYRPASENLYLVDSDTGLVDADVSAIVAHFRDHSAKNADRSASVRIRVNGEH